MALDTDDLAKIQAMVQQTIQAMTPTPVVTDPTPTPTPDPAAPMPPEATFQKMLEDTLAKVTQKSEQTMATQMWDQRMEQLQQQNPALVEYLSQGDEFGVTRMDRLQESGDIADRVKRLNTVATNYAQAQIAGAGQGNSPAPIPKAVQDRADKVNKKYDDLNAQFNKGEMNPEEFTQSFFDEMDNEGLFAAMD